MRNSNLTLGLLGLFMGAQVALGQSLFSLNGKSYAEKDLPPALKQDFYEADAETFQRKHALIEEAILQMWFTEEAAKQKTTVEKIQEKSFAVKDPSDAEIKAFYEKHKDRIPPNYTFDAIKPQLADVIKREKQNDKKKEILDKLYAKKTASITLVEPEAPQMTIDTLNYPSKGDQKSSITIIEFADYQCPHCKHAFDEMKQFWPKIAKKARFYFMDFPINPSGVSRKVAIGAQCAHQQNKFWEFHEMAYEKQKDLSNESSLAFAKALKLDEKKFQACFDNPATAEVVDKAQKIGTDSGVKGTPSVFVNGKKVMITTSFEEAILQAIAKEQKGKA